MCIQVTGKQRMLGWSQLRTVAEVGYGYSHVQDIHLHHLTRMVLDAVHLMACRPINTRELVPAPSKTENVPTQALPLPRTPAGPPRPICRLFSAISATAFLIGCAGQNFGREKNLQTSRGRNFDIWPPSFTTPPFAIEIYTIRGPAVWRSRRSTAKAVWISGTSSPRKRATVPVRRSSLSSSTRNMASSRRARSLLISALRQE